MPDHAREAQNKIYSPITTFCLIIVYILQLNPLALIWPLVIGEDVNRTPRAGPMSVPGVGATRVRRNEKGQGLPTAALWGCWLLIYTYIYICIYQ